MSRNLISGPNCLLVSCLIGVKDLLFNTFSSSLFSANIVKLFPFLICFWLVSPIIVFCSRLRSARLSSHRIILLSTSLLPSLANRLHYLISCVVVLHSLLSLTMLFLCLLPVQLHPVLRDKTLRKLKWRLYSVRVL